jgi:hypothetical protein
MVVWLCSSLASLLAPIVNSLFVTGRLGLFESLCHFHTSSQLQSVNGESVLSKKDNSCVSSILPADAPLPQVAPRRIYLLGERNSGTHYTESILAKAFSPKYKNTVTPAMWAANSVRPPPPNSNERSEKIRQQKRFRNYPFAYGAPVFEFKHMFRHDLLSPKEVEILRRQDDIAWILVVRSPCDWADAMFRHPWHLCTTLDQCHHGGPHINLPKLPANTRRVDFWVAPWADYKESMTTPTAFTYRNVFHLRSHKLALMQQLIRTVPFQVHVAHLKQVERAPNGWIQHLVSQFGLTVNKKYVAPLPSKRPHSTLCLSREEFEIAQREIDWELEGLFGFSPLDCHICLNSTTIT